MCSRLVILPDYQGIGLGIRFLTKVAEVYKNMGFVFHIVTSAKNMIMGLNKNPKWRFTRYNAIKASQINKGLGDTQRTNCKTATFELR